MQVKKVYSSSLYVLVLIFGIITIATAKVTPIYQGNTLKIVTQLKQKANAEKVETNNIGNIVVWTALQLQNSQYAYSLLDKKTPEYLLVTLDQTDCMLFVEEVLATSELIKFQRLNASNLAAMTNILRYHGKLSYCARNNYFKDWALSNIKNGFVTDIAYGLTKINYPDKADILSTVIKNSPTNIHKDSLQCIADRENYINAKTLGFIPMEVLDKNLKYIKNGDIIGIVRSPNGKADGVHHLGIAYIQNGVVSMIHASSDHHKVIISPSLVDYLKQFKNSQGIILLRPVYQLENYTNIIF